MKLIQVNSSERSTNRKMKSSKVLSADEFITKFTNNPPTLKNLEFIQFLGKGANSVVHLYKNQ